MMKRCNRCKGTGLVQTTFEDELEVAGRIFRADLPALRCERCGEETIGHEAVKTFELAVAEVLARGGPMTGEVFRFMRKAAGLKAVEAAEVLDIAQETISRWENGKTSPESRAMVLLGSIILDLREGKTTTLDRLRALREPPSDAEGTVTRLEVDASGSAV